MRLDSRQLQYSYETGFRVQGTGYRVHGAGYRVQGTECRVQGTECRVQSTGYRVQGTEYRVQSRGYRVQGTGYGVQGTDLAWLDTAQFCDTIDTFRTGSSVLKTLISIRLWRKVGIDCGA